eukprot:1051048_1
MEEFSRMIFNHFYYNYQKANQVSTALQIDTINQEISNIISQRKLKKTTACASDRDTTDDTTDNNHESDPLEPLNITQLADVMIQEIASYLPLKSYSKFQRCSRSIFYAANSPSALYEFDRSINLQQHSNTKNMQQMQSFMKRFSRIQKLRVNMFNEKFICLAQFRNLKHLQLVPSKNKAQQYLSQTIFSWDTITHLDICCNYAFGIIKRCKYLRTLAIDEFYDDEAATLSHKFAQLKCLPRLHGLVLRTGAIIDPRIVLKDVCESLQSLTICVGYHNVDGLIFNNLVDLGLQFPSSEAIVSIIKRTKHLKSLRLFPFKATEYSSFKHIFELSTLEYLFIQCDDSTEILTLVQWIDASFFRKREKLKLEIDCYKCLALIGDVFESIARLWNTLYTFHSKHFMLIFTYCVPSTFDHDCLTIVLLKAFGPFGRSLNHLSEIFSVIRVPCNVGVYMEKIIVSNKNSVFTGHSQAIMH